MSTPDKTGRRLPAQFARCLPDGGCPQQCRCARADHELADPFRQVIDPTAVQGQWRAPCAFFLDSRHPVLEAA